ncbi:acetyl-CoA hydrolase/transferase family protein [Skermania piniformis]|uniref:acetyl-CoA hydrolase/transferase family protein n=1 Tax=Skermania pinensis TaxID=39122 RepID=UPI00082D6CE0|nr:acetyl-CoA hydrolase/transferase C-terminal domain-containing protein [Skermania piniformis]
MTAVDLRPILRPGDRIVAGQACGEPTTLIEALIAQAGDIPDLSLFIATSFSGLLTPAAVDGIRVASMGAIGALRGLTKAHRLSVVPCHVSRVGPMISSGEMPCDVAFIQVAPAEPDGTHSLGLISDHVLAAVRAARVVVAEVNERVPRSCGERIDTRAIDHVVPVARDPVRVQPATITPVDEAIARHVAEFVEDGSVLQTGIGAVPDAVLRLLRDRADLGVHSGMIGDGLVDLVESGVITNARKEIDTGVSVTGALIGTERLYRFADRNPAIRMCTTDHTHDPAVLARLSRLVTVNAAVEVDLTGQVNAEQSGTAYLGGTGGQVDFVRAGARSPGGHAIIVAPSTAKGGTVSRITPGLSGPVTTARSEVDVIVTEYGAARLAGCTLAERARRLTAISHPDFRDGLEQAARAIEQRGF